MKSLAADRGSIQDRPRNPVASHEDGHGVALVDIGGPPRASKFESFAAVTTRMAERHGVEHCRALRSRREEGSTLQPGGISATGPSPASGPAR
jgi:hypothetical protein